MQRDNVIKVYTEFNDKKVELKDKAQDKFSPTNR